MLIHLACSEQWKCITQVISVLQKKQDGCASYFLCKNGIFVREGVCPRREEVLVVLVLSLILLAPSFRQVGEIEKEKRGSCDHTEA